MIAEFEGMLDPRDFKTVIAKGPFIVEVARSPGGKGKRYYARMIPTQQVFFENVPYQRKGKPAGTHAIPLERTSEADLRMVIEHRFKKKTKEWRESNERDRAKMVEPAAERPQEAANGKQ